MGFFYLFSFFHSLFISIFVGPPLLLLFNMNPKHPFYQPLPYHPQYSFYYPPIDPYSYPYWTYQLTYPMIPQYDSRQSNAQNLGASNIMIPSQFNSSVNVKLQAQIENPPQACPQKLSCRGEQVGNVVSKEVTSKKKQESENKGEKKQKMGSELPKIKIEEVQEMKPPKTGNKQNTDIAKIILQIFESYMIRPAQYNSLITQTIENQTIEQEFITMINQKIKSFRKSKEEMIKIVIRRTQKHYKSMHQCKRDGRFVKYGGFKSMNAVYLETMFSDPSFVQAFQEVAMAFREEYEQENFQKIQTLCQLIKNQKVKNHKELFIQIVSEKNKMPWPRCWINKMMRNIHWIYANFSKQYLKREIANALQQKCT